VRATQVVVYPRDGEPFAKTLARFTNVVKNLGILRDYRQHLTFTPKSELRRIAKRRGTRLARKRQASRP
jgi:ribosomal protein S21